MIELSFDTSIYNADIIQLAAYRHIDRLAILLSEEGASIRCMVTVNENLVDRSDAIVADFQKEILDQQLRSKIKRETEQVRNLILSLAFSKSGLQG